MKRATIIGSYLLWMVAFVSFGQCQGTGDEGGGGGGTSSVLTFDLVTDIESPVVLGEVVVAGISNKQNGTPPYTYAWGKCCPSSANPSGNCATMADTAPAMAFCMDRVDKLRITAALNDSSGKSAVVTKDLVVQGPDGVGFIGDPESNSGPPLFTVLHRFRFKAGEKPLGACYENCVYEKVVGIREDGTWPSDPVDWGLTSCPDDPKPGFYYDAPEIRDKKVSIYSPEQWANYAIGDVLDEYKQWIGLKVAACSPKATVIYPYGPMHFKIKKVSLTKLKHVLQ